MLFVLSCLECSSVFFPLHSSHVTDNYELYNSTVYFLHCFDFHAELTKPQLRFLSTLQKVWGGVSPLFVMMTQMSVTASEFWGWTGSARRYVMNMRWDVAELLLTFAQRPNGVASMTSQPWIRRSLPSYRTLQQRTNTDQQLNPQKKTENGKEPINKYP